MNLRVAEKVAAAHNEWSVRQQDYGLPAGQIMLDRDGYAPRWFPAGESLGDERRIVVPVGDSPITPDQAQAMIDELRAQIEEYQQQRAREREESRFRNSRVSYRGFTSTHPCFQCGRFKTTPSARCDYCGDEPVSHNGDAASFDRSYGVR